MNTKEDMKMEDVKIKKFTEEGDMDLMDGSYLAVNISNMKGFENVELVYYTPEQDIEDQITFKEFSDLYLGENLQFSLRNGGNIVINENNAQGFGASCRDKSDCDEDAGVSYNFIEVNAQQINVYKDIKKNELQKYIKDTQKDFENLKIAELENETDSRAEQKDAYAYRGLNRNDFF